jgi:2-polyprenyl-3-methyl-5-hydroxy-6-metoxy-1,4-benzoquinol methylase
MPIDTTKDNDAYTDFYESVGRNYPETQIVHKNMGIGSRFQTVLSELAPFALKGASLIDIGCNDGVYTIPYCEMGGAALGIDISASLIMRARKLAKEVKSAGFVAMDIQAELRSYRQYDVALMSEVLEHLNQPSAAIRNVYKLLKKGGFFLLTCPTPLFEVFDSIDRKYLLNLFSNKLLEHQKIDANNTALSKFGIEDYLYRHDGYYPRGIKSFIEKFGFQCVKYYTICFDRRPVSLLRCRNFLELIYRRIPLFNLLGITNVQLFRKL